MGARKVSDEQIVEAVASGHSQTKVASMFGVSQGTVSKAIKRLAERLDMGQSTFTKKDRVHAGPGDVEVGMDAFTSIPLNHPTKAEELLQTMRRREEKKTQRRAMIDAHIASGEPERIAADMEREFREEMGLPRPGIPHEELLRKTPDTTDYDASPPPVDWYAQEALDWEWIVEKAPGNAFVVEVKRGEGSPETEMLRIALCITFLAFSPTEWETDVVSSNIRGIMDVMKRTGFKPKPKEDENA